MNLKIRIFCFVIASILFVVTGGSVLSVHLAQGYNGSIDADGKMKYTGKVFKTLYAVGSKSEREAVMIRMEEGEFLLRRLGDNPFENESISDLVGKDIECEGQRTETTLIITDCKVIEP
ncbi:MAG: hypothetical protein F6K24_45770 [Okeania sp. SIO2D1]|nr:hypothetical protein [Okeania sp. SIO2D1]